ncbi:F-box protein [Iris pallida]|uniref:F-box protein n=1 Tax=Iris pallida TaxID=29817 RepID=A0AAX6G855_IRIPA|nr:F-box protein [Iris pallida]
MPSAFHPLNLHTKNNNKKKRRKTIQKQQQQREEEEEEEEDDEESVGFELKSSCSSRTHHIQPLGNLLLVGPSANIRNPGLGSLHVLPDDILLDLLSLLSAKELSILSTASRSFFVFATHDPLWRSLVLREFQGDFVFSGSWRSTYFSSSSSNCPDSPSSTILVNNFYSDYLFQSWLCANLKMKPEWLRRDNIPRRRGLSMEEFVRCFEEPNKPVLLEGCIDSWPALRKWTCRDHLVRVCGDVKFTAGPVEMKLDSYFRYADKVKEERPLYVFDPKFVEKVPELGSGYEVPLYFKEDMFSVLGEERPDFRWIIIGPAGSGSSFHVDPNSTSAWNAVIKGSKKWVMFPPEVVPPGVHPSPDGAEVACPVSITEWFMNFYGACENWKKRPVECVCKAGEVVFVPNGWWHLVINLEDSIAITQNYVSRRNLLNVLDFLKKPNASELVSGTSDRVNIHCKFRSAIETAFPGTIDKLTLEAQTKMATQQKKQSFWNSVTDSNVGGFKFSF